MKHKSHSDQGSKIIELPKPSHGSDVSLESTLLRRRSVRKYKGDPLALSEVSQLLWAAQGISKPPGYRTAPSAGPCYPLETYLVAGNVTGLDGGLYKFIPVAHGLERVFPGDVRPQLAKAALNQKFIKEAPISIVFSAVFERTTKTYGQRGMRYVHMDVGHAGENIHLQAVSLGLGTVVVGAFDDAGVKAVLKLPEEEEPLYIMPVGKPR